MVKLVVVVFPFHAEDYASASCGPAYEMVENFVKFYWNFDKIEVMKIFENIFFFNF